MIEPKVGDFIRRTDGDWKSEGYELQRLDGRRAIILVDGCRLSYLLTAGSWEIVKSKASEGFIVMLKDSMGLYVATGNKSSRAEAFSEIGARNEAARRSKDNPTCTYVVFKAIASVEMPTVEPITTELN